MARSTIPLLSGLLLTLAVLAADNPAPKATPKPPTEAEIANAVRDLGSGRFAVRERASKILWEAGALAEPALKEAAKNSDAEVSSRAKAILEKFDWGIYPDTPKEVLDQIQAFRAGDKNARTAAIGELIRMRPVRFATLRKLLAHEENPDTRLELYQRMAHEARQAVPELLGNGDVAGAEELLETCLYGSVEESATDYAAFQFLRGTLDKAVARFEKERAVGGASGDRAAEVLVYLYRVKRDWPKALKAAEQTKKEDLIEAVLWEAGDWKALAKRPKVNQGLGNEAGLYAAYERLAGNAAKFDEAVADIKKAADAAGDDRNEVRMAADALLLNGRAEDALKLLLDKKRNLALTFDLLCAQMRFKEAFALVDAARDEDTDPGERSEIEVRRARMLYMLGDRDSALQLFRKLAESIKEPSDLQLARTLVRTEARLGLKELAGDHAARAIDKLGKAGARDGFSQLLEPVFDRNKDVAETWWLALRAAAPDDDPAAVMKRVREVLGGKAGKELPARLAVLEKAASPFPGGRVPRELMKPVPNTIELQEPANIWTARKQRAAAEAYLAAGQEGKAEELFAKAAETSTLASDWLRLGDVRFEHKRYREAAEAYRKAWLADKAQPLGLYLQGRALVRAGDDKEGKRLIELAHWLPLGNEYLRGELADELGKRNWPEAARKEAETVLRTGWYRHWYVGNVLSQMARVAVHQKDYFRAAEYYERGVVGCLKTGANFVESSAYLAVPEAVRINRARGLLAQGKLDEAAREAEASLKVMPGNVDLVIALVPELDAKGRKKEADALFNRVRDAFEKLCKDYPNGAWAHNSAAWMMALCRRDLDSGLKHASRAAELEPKNAGYLDTLAEVNFRKGNRERALELMKQCAALEPNNVYFRKQLERFRTQGPDSPVPDSDDE